MGEGATDVGLLADASRLKGDQGQRFVDSASSLVDTMRDHGARVWVVLGTDRLTPDDTVAACHRPAGTGVWLVQGGSWKGARTSLTRIQLMRKSLPPAHQAQVDVAHQDARRHADLHRGGCRPLQR